MLTLFQYNWQVREEWLQWCRGISATELVMERTGGMGSFRLTLLHIIDVEYSWVRALMEKSDIEIDFTAYNTIDEIENLSIKLQQENWAYLTEWIQDTENQMVYAAWLDQSFTKGEIIRHIIVHEIHHIGQLSIWAREIGMKPVSANFIDRGLDNISGLDKEKNFN